ncbi:response regulator transcription factor [Fibrella aquatica]|uniref:response regulator transcription factor n=1 Tax=Fibrella aquatica TaxID=3242487 RepID=UPI003522514E
MKKILIIEDDERIAQNIGRSLVEEHYKTEVAHDGYGGRALALQEAYDLVILDINLPGMNGFEVCRSLRAEKPFLPIIMLTALGEVADKVTGLELGADDYVVKPFDIRELIARVATCLRRAEQRVKTAKDDVIQVADLTVNCTARMASRQGVSIDLTAKEFALLEYLSRHQGRIVSKMDLNRYVWNFTFDPGTNIVEVYINYLRKKIDRNFEPKLIHTKPGLGYMLTDEPL